MATSSSVTERFVLHWGEMAARWGINRTVAQIHALLYLAGRPLNAEDIAEALQVARSNVSTSLRELQNWDLVKVVHLLGDRRDHYETLQDPWDLLRVIVRERKEREFDPTTRMLREIVAHPDFAREPADAQDRIRATMELMGKLGAWADEMLRLSPGTLDKVLSLGASVQRFVRGDGAAAPADARKPGEDDHLQGGLPMI
jgi:DNA-binding transcriptional regulator GbsR (MarR family)